MSSSSAVTFRIHNSEHTVRHAENSPETTLLQYLRDQEHLTGTKYMCHEGGCGACVVAVTAKHPLTKRTVTFAVNSCLVSIFSCQGWQIHTVDGIGNKKTGYHPVQKILAEFNGTQCGFCSPGMVMNMYALYETNRLTMREIENSFGGNLCRCTGYRPILTAFKSLAEDADYETLGEYPDIEDLEQCANNGKHCQNKCQIMCKKHLNLSNYFSSSESKWFKVNSINEIFDIFQNNPGSTYQLVGGNTAKGVYIPKTAPDIYIDITNVTSLINVALVYDTLVIGANMTMHDTINLFRRTAQGASRFSYLSKLADHMEKIAHVAIRNIGTLAGNISIKHQHNDFPSDIFLMLETVGAKLLIASSKTTEQQLSLGNYLSYDMDRKIIKKIFLPTLDASHKFGSYKVMPRAQNAHAMVNAGFLLKLDKLHNVQAASIVYGGINPSFVRAVKAETYLMGKKLFDNDTLQGTFDALNEDINPDLNLPNPSPKFRKDLAISLFYKFVLSIAPANIVSPEKRSGGFTLERPISKGVQDFQSNKSLYPLTEPIPKIEALGQTSGEVEYTSDIPNLPNQLFAYFVTAKAPAHTIISKVDPSAALKFEGVVAFFDKNDIPGQNSFIPLNANYPPGFIPPIMQVVPEELFCSGVVQYYYQPVGIIVAYSQEIAEKAADIVKIEYTPGKKKPLLTIRQILDAGATDRITTEATLERRRKGDDVKHVIKGTFETGWQYPFHMETQNCLVVPKEDQLDIYPSTQWMDFVQMSVANVLNMPENKINIFVRRVGGAYGGKITRSALPASATALAAVLLQKPVRMRMSFSTNMDVIGSRFPCFANYDVGVNDKGEIQYLDTTFYFDYGAGGNEPALAISINGFYESYKHDTWKVVGNNTKTDNHASGWVRAPGHTTIVGIVETLMEHIAMVLNKDPFDIRITNMDVVNNKDIIKHMNELKEWSDYTNRRKAIADFNKENHWIKRGISIVPMMYRMVYVTTLTSLVTIYAGDGSVSVAHGGIEIGQGINTKVAQVCAWALGIPLNMVSIKSSNNVVSPNSFATGGSLTSECVCYATIKACETLLDRMKPVKEKMTNPTWQQLVKRCQEEFVNLSATYMFSPNDVQGYDVYAVGAAEVEVDILTGVHQVTRVDLLEDTGNSISPCIDIGQIEGAFIMGLGFWTTEETIFDENGKLLTDRTWNYKIPSALDIPIDYRVKFPKNNPNSKGILYSKATGEPALCVSCSIPIAIRQAVASARLAADPNASRWYPISGPSTVENTFLNCLNDYRQYKL